MPMETYGMAASDGESIEGRLSSMEGNEGLASTEEERVASYLRCHNLEHANLVAKPVKPADNLYVRYFKRLLDIAIALPACVVLLPLKGLRALCTFVDVGRPILFKQTRIGKGGKPFTMVKFRNMTNERDADGRLLPPSERVTKFGRLMRKYSLDELLNLWNVVKGDMSIIGPRPQPVFLYERMSERHKAMTTVRPGLECPRVLELTSFGGLKYEQSYENAVWYVENANFAVDIRMFIGLVRMVFAFGRRNQQAKGEGFSYFVGYNEEGQAISLNNFRRYHPDKLALLKVAQQNRKEFIA